MSVLAVFAQLGLLSVLIFAGIGAATGLLVRGGRRAAIIGGVIGTLLICVALAPSQVFRAQIGQSVVAIFWLAVFLTPILLYALVIRRARRRVRGDKKPAQPEPGLRIIEQDDALFAEQLAKLVAVNSQQPGYARDQFSLAWRGQNGEVVGALRVTIFMGLAEIRVLHVDPAHRGAGIGAALLRGAEEEAARRGAHLATLHTFSWQVPEFYRRAGWQEVRTLPLAAGAQQHIFEKTL